MSRFPEEETALLADYLLACSRLSVSFEELLPQVASLLPVGEDEVDRFESTQRIFILAFLKSFEQFEETLQRTLKTIIQVMEQGKVERLSGVDIANRSAALGAISDERRWSDAVRTRNKLAHEYPTRRDKRAAQVNDAWAHRDTLRDVWNQIQLFVEKESLQ